MTFNNIINDNILQKLKFISVINYKNYELINDSCCSSFLEEILNKNNAQKSLKNILLKIFIYIFYFNEYLKEDNKKEIIFNE